MGQTVCMHAGYGPIRKSQTTGSMICHLTKSSMPSLSSFFLSYIYLFLVLLNIKLSLQIIDYFFTVNKPHWVTGTSAPCTSVFFPVWLDAFPDCMFLFFVFCILIFVFCLLFMYFIYLLLHCSERATTKIVLTRLAVVETRTASPEHSCGLPGSHWYRF